MCFLDPPVQNPSFLEVFWGVQKTPTHKVFGRQWALVDLHGKCIGEIYRSSPGIHHGKPPGANNGAAVFFFFRVQRAGHQKTRCQRVFCPRLLRFPYREGLRGRRVILLLWGRWLLVHVASNLGWSTPQIHERI